MNMENKLYFNRTRKISSAVIASALILSLFSSCGDASQDGDSGTEKTSNTVTEKTIASESMAVEPVEDENYFVTDDTVTDKLESIMDVIKTVTVDFPKTDSENPVDIDGTPYYPVTDTRFPAYSDFTSYISEALNDEEFVSTVLESGVFKDIDGKLYIAETKATLDTGIYDGWYYTIVTNETVPNMFDVDLTDTDVFVKCFLPNFNEESSYGVCLDLIFDNSDGEMLLTDKGGCPFEMPKPVRYIIIDKLTYDDKKTISDYMENFHATFDPYFQRGLPVITDENWRKTPVSIENGFSYYEVDTEAAGVSSTEEMYENCMKYVTENFAQANINQHLDYTSDSDTPLYKMIDGKLCLTLSYDSIGNNGWGIWVDKDFVVKIDGGYYYYGYYYNRGRFVSYCRLKLIYEGETLKADELVQLDDAYDYKLVYTYLS